MSDTTIIYLRLSKEDELTRDESNSISNQRIMLMKYVNEHEDLAKTEVIEIKDDGYSGKNMQRPGMTRLLEMVRKGQVQNIVVKDFSRFSRDHIELGKYAEQIFPRLDIRFIAVNDGYDSNDYAGGIGGIDISVKAVLYDFFSQDLSVKVRSSLKSSRDSGKHICAFAPYGYRKKSDDKYCLEEDSYSAEYVRRIFMEYAEGSSMYSIARRLNEDEVMTPMQYIQQRDNNSYGRNVEQSGWTINTVRRILMNEVYIGSLVYDKSVDAEVAKRATQLKPVDDWTRIENVHVPIVDRETFDAVQKRLACNVAEGQYHEPSIFKGKIVCGGCGYRMQVSHKGRTKFQCNHKYCLTEKTGAGNCASSILEEDLMEIAAGLLKEKINHLTELQELADAVRKKQKERQRAAEERLNQMNKSLSRLYQDQINSYEAYRDGRTDKETYLKQKDLTETMIEKLKENAARQEEAAAAIAAECDKMHRLDRSIELDGESLDRDLIDLLIDRIIINADKTVEVIWKFSS